MDVFSWDNNLYLQYSKQKFLKNEITSADLPLSVRVPAQFVAYFS